MSREANIPLFLWIATAALIHLGTGEGAERAGAVLEERLDIKRFAASVQRHVHFTANVVEVELTEDDPTLFEEEKLESDEGEIGEEIEETTKPDPEADAEQSPQEAPSVDELAQLSELEKQKLEEEQERDLREERRRQEDEEKAKEKDKDQLKAEPIEAKPVPDLKVPKRVAVKQHVQDKDQEQNPNAKFIADEANHVAQETRARITAVDQNAPDPTLGTNQTGPADSEGNAHVTEVAHASESAGDDRRAPSEDEEGGEQSAQTKNQSHGALQLGGLPHAPQSEQQPQTASRGQSAQKATEAQLGSPELVTSGSGGELAPTPREAKAARAGRKARKSRRAVQRRAETKFGLGGTALSPGGVNLNLSHGDAFASIGRDTLAREIKADGARRLSLHRGRWQNLGLERWRPAIENYIASVQTGNTTALNTAGVPFASYLNQIHSRLHPIFADDFLAFLDGMPREHPMNRPDMKTDVEIVLSGEDGRLVRMGVTRSSGSTAFDIGALESVHLAAPYGPPPSVIRSPDGNVYLHWEFHRNRYFACSTYFARPKILKAKPESAPPPDLRPPVRPNEETGSSSKPDQPTQPDKSKGSKPPEASAHRGQTKSGTGSGNAGKPRAKKSEDVPD